MKHISPGTVKKRGASVLVCIIFSLALFVSSGGCAPGLTGSSSAQVDFDKFTEELFCKEIAENLINLHFTVAHPKDMGITDYEVTYGDISKESIAECDARLENYLAVLDTFSPKNLSTKQQITYDILKDYFNLQLSTTDYYLYDEILSPSSGLQANLPILLEEYTFYEEKDVKDYLALLPQTKGYFEQVIAFEKEKAAAGLFMPDFSCQSIIDQCNEFVAAADNHFLIETFIKRLENVPGLSDSQKDTYIALNEKLVKEDLAAAYEYLGNEMTALIDSEKNDKGLCYFPEGKEYYETLVYYSTGSSDNIKDLQDEIAQALSDDLLACYELMEKNPDIWDECVAASLTKKDASATLCELQEDMLADFPKPPVTNYTVNYIDESIADFVAPAYYIVAPIDEYDSHSIYINKETNTTDIYYFTTLAHEGFPGHLYQTVMTYESGFPAVRSMMNYSGYTEGWATYVEMMAYSYADIDPDVATLLQKNQSATLSLYAATDIGIHYEGWDLDETKNFWSHYGIDDEEVIQNIYEYIVGEPANYLKYYVGYLEFMELREKAEETYGEAFDEIAFHNALLSIGPAPFDIVEKYLNVYYAQ